MSLSRFQSISRFGSFQPRPKTMAAWAVALGLIAAFGWAQPAVARPSPTRSISSESSVAARRSGHELH
jgi:hypothetical protein